MLKETWQKYKKNVKNIYYIHANNSHNHCSVRTNN